MAIKRRNKVNANFSMASLTDIIFLLLIFFMLTSTLVAPNALNLRLPGLQQVQRTTEEPLRVSINLAGDVSLNGRAITLMALENELRKEIDRKGSPERVVMTIDPAKRVAVEHVVNVMDVALRLNIQAILATEV